MPRQCVVHGRGGGEGIGAHKWGAVNLWFLCLLQCTTITPPTMKGGTPVASQTPSLGYTKRDSLDQLWSCRSHHPDHY